MYLRKAKTYLCTNNVGILIYHDRFFLNYCEGKSVDGNLEYFDIRKITTRLCSAMHIIGGKYSEVFVDADDIYSWGKGP